MAEIPKELIAIFRKWKTDGDIDIWFPTDLAYVSDNVLLMTVYSPNGGHTSGSWGAAIDHTVNATLEEYQSLKESYERSHNVRLIPKTRFLKKYQLELEKQWKEWIRE